MLCPYGHGHYAGRRSQFLDPQPFAPLIGMIFQRDPKIDPSRVFVTGTKAFGQFSLWSQQVFVVNLDI